MLTRSICNMGCMMSQNWGRAAPRKLREAHFGQGLPIVIGPLTLAECAPGASMEDLEDTAAGGGGAAVSAVRQPKSSILPCRWRRCTVMTTSC